MRCEEGRSVVGTGDEHFRSRKTTGLGVDSGRRPLKWTAYHLGRIRRYHIRSNLESIAILFESVRPDGVVDCGLKGGLEGRKLVLLRYLDWNERGLDVLRYEF